jgi:hypothetical protein
VLDKRFALTYSWLVRRGLDLAAEQALMRQRQENNKPKPRPKQNEDDTRPRPAKPPKWIVRIPGGCPWGHGPEHKNAWGHCLICSRERYHRDPALKNRQVAGVKRRRLERTAEDLLANLKRNARKRGHEFGLRPADILPLPTHCPVLGTELKYFSEDKSCRDDLASFDRRNSNLGYVPGNVTIMSYRANRMKCNATVEEVRQLLAWMEKQ